NELAEGNYLRESLLGDDELRKGNPGAASRQFLSLLAYIEAQPEGTPEGRGSLEHAKTLDRLARCLRESGQLAAAETMHRKAVSISKELMKRDSFNERLTDQYAVFLGNFGNTLLAKGQYPQ